MNKDAQTINAKSDPLTVKGQRQEKGSETFIEIKGPTGLGARSSTPYFKVYPQYRKQAEKALDREQIPAEHRQRVRDYFDSLQGGGK